MSGILDKSGAEAGLPTKTLADGTVSKVTLVPFYDRTGLIYETLGTLYEAINQQILITILVIIVMVYNLRASLLISALLPMAVLMCFIFMKQFGVDANIVALSGIAIAIGTMVDLGIILNENVLRHLEIAPKGPTKLKTVYLASAEVSGAILTAVSTTIISFLPVFTLQAAEGKLFGPLAYTKTFALISAIKLKSVKAYSLLPFLGFCGLAAHRTMDAIGRIGFVKIYPRILNWCLAHKALFSLFPLFIILLGISVWLGFGRVFGVVPKALDVVGVNIRSTGFWSGLTHTFPGLGKEFMPSLNEGSFLLMPTTMPHSGIQENKEILQKLDMLVTAIPEVDMIVGKAGRAETAIDPAPISMFENTINYKSEYATDINGNRLRFKVSEGKYELKDSTFYDPSTMTPNQIKVSDLIEDEDGEYFRQWRDHIRTPDDIWNEIVSVINLPGVTSSPKLHPSKPGS
ncbi:putative cation efflux system protein CusA-like [Daphnia sinensis]|uniref:Cation efflux system protein CusA-like n=1 Tax=Daphnia sinensis TaxID=1820382 RepID=A0AAD5KDR0_9CRUS|nr:putative cation efflux system protein CusA-like [Daphnia sinensis]